ncbi:MAG: helix-turn-helix domain-containing protein [Limnohabitans sp.]
MSKGKWLEASMVSRRINVSLATVYRLIKSGSLHSTRMGVSGCLRVSEKSIVEFEQHRASSMDEFDQ